MPQFHLTFACVRGGRAHGRADDRPDVERGQLEGELALLGAGDQRQVLQQTLQPAGGLLQYREGRSVDLDDAVGQPFVVGLDRRQRGAQFVGEVGQEPPAGVLGVLERVGHLVERVGQVGELVVGGGTGCAFLEPAVGERPGGAGELLDGPGDPGGQQPGDGGGGDRSGQNPEGERQREGLGQGPVEVVGDDIRDGADRTSDVVVEDGRGDEERDDAERGGPDEDDQQLADEQPPDQPSPGGPGAHASTMR